MRAAELIHPLTYCLTDMPIEDPGPGELQVRIKSVGVCGSDLHAYSEGSVGSTSNVCPSRKKASHLGEDCVVIVVSQISTHIYKLRLTRKTWACSIVRICKCVLEQYLRAAGAQVQRGDLDDLESLCTGAAQSDGVTHTAFRHDWSKFAESCAMDKRAIDALGSALEGSHRPLLVTGGAASLVEGRPATEEDPPISPSDSMPCASEPTGLSFVERGVNASVVRLPQVHNTVKRGLITYLVALAREKGVSAYIGEGLNRWAAAYVLAAARLYRLALEKREAGARYSAVAEEGVPLRDIAEVIGRVLKVPVVGKSPEEAAAHFGFLALFVGRNLVISSKFTQERLGWRPTGVTLISDLENMHYFEA